MGISHSADKINTIIKHALDKQEITPAEYEEILVIAESDGYLDSQEKAAIANLRSMIMEKTIKVTRANS